MKSAGFGFGGSQSKGHGYRPDNDWEISEEISPDPFSEEEHTKIHTRRFNMVKNRNTAQGKENGRNLEKT